ncbi:DNA primase [Patescibacteria group bacterium]|nr:DNA primase [Patescibacteria group bacterium]
MSQIEEIKSKIDIVDLIREYINVKAVGANFQALCPFHNEKSPSFVISPEKQIWHCFGCGKGGDALSFVMEKEGLSFPEALRILADKAGVVLKQENVKERAKRNRILDILDLAGKYYEYILQSDSAKELRKYLEGRGLNEEKISFWRIGYSPDSWDSLYKFLKARPLSGEKYSDEEILKAGLIIKKEKFSQGSSYYDRFRDRIMFPIWDINGNIVAFTARVNPYKELTEKFGKYINSPQTEVYDKSRLLFGLDKAKEEIRKKDLVVIVEGQMDAISCYNHGIKNVVASSGTALTKEQITLIKRFTNKVALVFDMDSAGQMAVDRGVRECLAQGMKVKIITLPSGKDPDESLKNNPGELERSVELAGENRANDFENHYKKPIENAKSILEYYFERSSAGLDLKLLENKSLVRDKMFEMIVLLPDKTEQGYWLKKISDDLGFSELDVREEFFRRYKDGLAPVNSYEKKKEAEEFKKPKEKSREERLSETVLAIIIKAPELIVYAVNNLSPEYLVTENLALFYNKLIIYYNKNAGLDYNSFLEDLADNEAETSLLRYLTLLGEKEFYGQEQSELKSQLINIIGDLKSYGQRRKIEALRQEISLAENNGDQGHLNYLMSELKKIMDLK